jgi:hypothetical protein
MSVITARRPGTPRGMPVPPTGTSALPTRLHVLLDIGVADDCAQVRAVLAAFAALGAAAGIPVDLGTAGGPTTLGRLEPGRLEDVARHLGAFARGFDGSPVLSHAIRRTGGRLPRVAQLVGARPLGVLVTARPPADRFATARALSESARRGLPWLVATTTPLDACAFAPVVAAAPGAVAVADVSDLRHDPEVVHRAVAAAWQRCTGAA